MSLGARKLLSLLLAAVLVAGQWAGQLHGLSHAKHDLAAALAAAASSADASSSANAAGSHKPPPLDHSADRCVAFHALDSAAVDTPLADFASKAACVNLARQHSPLRPAEPPPFSSRAPPVSLS